MRLVNVPASAMRIVFVCLCIFTPVLSAQAQKINFIEMNGNAIAEVISYSSGTPIIYDYHAFNDVISSIVSAYSDQANASGGGLTANVTGAVTYGSFSFSGSSNSTLPSDNNIANSGAYVNIEYGDKLTVTGSPGSLVKSFFFRSYRRECICFG